LPITGVKMRCQIANSIFIDITILCLIISVTKISPLSNFYLKINKLITMKPTPNPSENKTPSKNNKSVDNTKLLDIVSIFPDLPGVYLMKDIGGIVIYVGKAKNLKKRVKSYFLKGRDTRPTVAFLLPRIADIDFVVTKNEKEALILENTLIKKHKPKYNINLKDDKSYFSIKLTVKNAFPRMILTRKVKKDGSVYLGPYTSSASARETIEIIRDIFLIRTCSDSTLRNRSRACLNYQIKKCSAPCVGNINKADYKKSIEGVKMFLNGDVNGLIRSLKREMKAESFSENFEVAARIRDQINAINVTVEKQRAVTHKSSMNNDIIGAYREGAGVSINVINVRGGTIIGIKSHVFLDSALDAQEALLSFIKQYYHGDKEIPREIVVSEKLADLVLIKDWLSEKRESAVNIKVPKRGDSRRIMEMALENAKQSLLNKLKLQIDIENELTQIKEKLHLSRMPEVIECYDISNLMGKEAVGSKVVMQNGALNKDNYRRYKIRTRSESDDFGMMYEVLKRRFSRHDYMPDLIVIDGGKGHLGIALRVMEELKITTVDVVSLAKEKRVKSELKDERVYLPGRKNPVVISSLGSAFNMLIRLRDEAHRFAITYHKNLRSKKLTGSIFDGIKGIGPKKRELILSSITSLDDITAEKLGEVKGLSKGDVATIINYFTL